MQAITTKYIGPSNVKGSRVKATCAAGSLTLHWDDSLNSDANHCSAALALAVKLEWDYGKWVGGTLPDGTMAWVNMPREPHSSRPNEWFELVPKHLRAVS